jgi:hypothetical protein
VGEPNELLSGPQILRLCTSTQLPAQSPLRLLAVVRETRSARSKGYGPDVINAGGGNSRGRDHRTRGRGESASHIRIGRLAWARGRLRYKILPLRPRIGPHSQCATLTTTTVTNKANRKLDRRRGAALAGDGFGLRRAARALGGAEEARALPARGPPMPPGTPRTPALPLIRCIACAIAFSAGSSAQICLPAGRAAPDPALSSCRIGSFGRR